MRARLRRRRPQLIGAEPELCVACVGAIPDSKKPATSARPLRASPDAGETPLCDSSSMRRRVLIVDDHDAFRAAARALLEAGGFQVVGEAADGASAIREVAKLRPDVVLLDIQLPDLDGFEVAERLAGNGPAIVLTSSRSVTSFRRRLAATGWSFIPKSELSGEALAAAVAG
jgi:CheY-like chemotaxis protein